MFNSKAVKDRFSISIHSPFIIYLTIIFFLPAENKIIFQGFFLMKSIKACTSLLSVFLKMSSFGFLFLLPTLGPNQSCEYFACPSFLLCSTSEAKDTAFFKYNTNKNKHVAVKIFDIFKLLMLAAVRSFLATGVTKFSGKFI